MAEEFFRATALGIAIGIPSGLIILWMLRRWMRRG
jgi:hypothetical protein